ncbi:hypothetical protein, unlikely [Trypanosoma congolense IL3000]|uniref:Secreted protein n=1 Tax=Trypanosoma congolense (strain IL3000) TaxID=1068625 RepID=F9W6K5_TRYCI|nr:hypothetical protein, unlikely [Trypanosoma congolense IL3000]
MATATRLVLCLSLYSLVYCVHRGAMGHHLFSYYYFSVNGQVFIPHYDVLSLASFFDLFNLLSSPSLRSVLSSFLCLVDTFTFFFQASTSFSFFKMCGKHLCVCMRICSL